LFNLARILINRNMPATASINVIINSMSVISGSLKIFIALIYL
jgi:hypothetical protein